MQNKALPLHAGAPCYNLNAMKKDMMYRSTVPIREMSERYLEPDRFEESCRSCENYGCNPGCPPHDFDVPGFWRRYAYLDLYALSIPASSSWEEGERKLSDQLLTMESAVPGSLALLPGSSGSPRADGLRYSIQSLGGNVEKLCRERLGLSLQWAGSEALSGRLAVVGGLLRSTGGSTMRPIETKDLIIRASSEEDVCLFSEWEATDAVKAYFSIGEDQTARRVEQIFREDLQNEERKQYTIVSKCSGEPVGRIVLNDFQPGWKVEIFRIYIGDPEKRGRGFGRQAMEAILKKSFEEWGMERVYLDHYTGNPAGRLYLDLGFRYEGLLRKNCRKNGQLYDVHLMSMLRAEYEAAKAGYGEIIL